MSVVSRSIVKMDKFPAPDTAVQAPPGMGSIEPPEDGTKNLLVHSLWALNKLVVNKASAVKM